MDQTGKTTGGPKGPCSTCQFLAQDSDGGEPEYSVSWDVCDKFPTRSNLKSFPFKKPQSCHVLNFWHSEFAGRIGGGTDEQIKASEDKASAEYREWKEKTYPLIPPAVVNSVIEP